MISPLQSPPEGMVSGTGEVQTGRAMKRALFGRRGRGSSSPRPSVLALALALTGAWALAAGAWAGTSGEDGKDGQERPSEIAGRRELAAIVIATARTVGGATARETRAFTLAEGPGRDASVAKTAARSEGTSGTTDTPGASRPDFAFPQAGHSYDAAASGHTADEDGGSWPEAALRTIGRVLPPLGFEHGPSGPPAVALSVFMGRKNGDVFSSLHEEYAWRMKFKSMTLGLGFYREFSVGKRAHILPYVGVIRSSLSLRPAGLASEQLLHEYQLTVLCFGLPLVIGF